MKHFNWSIFLGCCAISIGIIIAGYSISNRITSVSHLQGELSLYNTISDDTQELGDYLSEYEVGIYLKIDDATFTSLVSSGDLDGTYAAVPGGKIFSKEKLSQWVEARIEGN